MDDKAKKGVDTTVHVPTLSPMVATSKKKSDLTV